MADAPEAPRGACAGRGYGQLREGHMAQSEGAAVLVDGLVRIWQADPATGRRVLCVLRDYAELTPAERRRVRGMAPDADVFQAERAIAAVWSPML